MSVRVQRLGRAADHVDRSGFPSPAANGHAREARLSG
jgi:hypothetical protein